LPDFRARQLGDLARSYIGRFTRRRITRKLNAHASRIKALVLTALPGPNRHRCNACNRDVAAFHRFGDHTMLCPLCGSTDRERLLIACIDRALLTLDAEQPKILQIAPNEAGLSQRLAQMGYLTKGDLEPARYGSDTAKVDLMDMALIKSIDLVILSHVLEHVPDDRHVMREIWSSLTPGGQVWILVPLIYDQTIEADPALSLQDRDLHFGGSDHVRAYGPDIADRLEQCGFAVRLVATADLPQADVTTYGLLKDVVFVATRQA
jgi:SAM-dependent methyltransferase